jgi:hypothetical protein
MELERSYECLAVPSVEAVVAPPSIEPKAGRHVERRPELDRNGDCHLSTAGWSTAGHVVYASHRRTTTEVTKWRIG